MITNVNVKSQTHVAVCKLFSQRGGGSLVIRRRKVGVCLQGKCKCECVWVPILGWLPAHP